MILQPAPPVDLITPMGNALALYLMDCGNAQSACWVVRVESTGAMATFDCNEVWMASTFRREGLSKLPPLHIKDVPLVTAC